MPAMLDVMCLGKTDTGVKPTSSQLEGVCCGSWIFGTYHMLSLHMGIGASEIKASKHFFILNGPCSSPRFHGGLGVYTIVTIV